MTGERALLCYPPGVEFMVGFFGCVYAGVIAVPAYPPRAHRNDPRLDSIAENCTPAIVLTSSEVHRDLARYVARSPRLAALNWLDATTVAIELADGWRDPRPAPGDLVALQYTSGSTGNPKGVMLNHGCLLHNVTRMREVLGLAEAKHAVCWLPTFHDMGLVGNYLQAVHCGVTLTCMSPAAFAHDPIRWLRAISQKRAFVSGGPCFAFQHCVNRMTPKKCEGLDLSCWKVAYVGAEPVSVAVLERFVQTFEPYGYRRETFFPTYGLAEATLMVTGGDFRAAPIVRGFRQEALEENRAEPDATGRQLVGCGRALEDMDVRIVDPATRLPVPEGRIGEIWVAGPSVAGGYWNRAEESADLFRARRADGSDTPYLRTGDFGFLQQGELFVSGRLKDLIIIRGRNFHPQDLESAVEEAIPELRGLGAAAFAVEADPVARLVIVQEAPRTFKAGQGNDLFLKARQAIAEQFELELSTLALIKMASIARASSGKVRRSETHRQFLAGALGIVEKIDAPEPIEETAAQASPTLGGAGMEAAIRDWLVARLSRRLGLPPEQIDRDKPFAAYLLDSMMMVSMAADLEQWMGRPLSPTLLYTAPTIASLARKLAGETGIEDNGEFQGPAPVPMAVVGIGCRFPCADNPDEFWQMLSEGKNGVGDLPAGRWPRLPRALATSRGGYLGDVEHFDAPFFGIAPREAVFIDPQHRLLLEVAWEALEHAGLAPDRLAGKTVGAFVGISNSDYGRVLTQHTGHADAYLGTGNSPSMAAHRLSYHLDLHGPSIAVDTACSSSLVSVHLACQSLRNGECELALAGGVNLLLAPDLTEALSRAGMLSPSACCKTFDAGADGYVRGEGCGLIVLKPLSSAIRDGDQVFAVVEASLINQDGRSNGITAPNGGAQTELIRRTLRLAHRRPEEISCIEAHGTGTPLGDPIEFDGLNDAIGTSDRPCMLSSVKTNVGHLEAAAGIVGLIKTILQIHHGKIVPHLHLDELNARINLAGSRFRIPRDLQPWEGDSRIAGVSSFGFGGTNAHVLASQGPALSPAAPPSNDRPVHVLPLSARSEQALRELAGRYLDWFARHRDASPADVCATAAQGRNHFAHRLAVRGSSLHELGDSLQRWLDGKRDPAWQTGTARTELPRHLAFLFTGQGSQYAGMGKQLYESCPIFRDNLDRCDNILRGHGFFSVCEALGNAERLEGTDVAQPALFALEYSLAQMWRHWGIEPAAVLGHSVGEYVAACVAGVFALEDGLRLIAERGKLMQACPEGTMLACFAPLAEIQERLERWQDFLSIAAVNGPESIVLAGDAGVMAAFQEELAAFSVETRPLHVRRAFHSRLIESALPKLRDVAAGIAQRSPNIRLISNKTGDFFQAAPDAGYWTEHARVPVQFARGIQTLHQAGITHFLEIGPEAVLSRLGPTCLTGQDAVWLPSLRRGKDDWQELLASLGKLYVEGAAIDWERFDGQRRRRLVLPTYPFQRQRYWYDDLPRGAASADETITVAPKADPAEITWAPRSNWSEGLPRLATGFDKLPGGLEGVAAPVVAAVKSEHDIGMFGDLREEFDRLAGGYVANTLKQLGWRPSADERFQPEQLAERFKVQPAYRRLLGRLLEIAAEDGWLAGQDGDWRVLRVPAALDVQAQHEELANRRADFAVELKLAHRCATQMHAVMRGEQDPLQVLFGEGAGQLTEQLYEKSPLSRFYNELLAECVAKVLLPLAEQRPIRILEVGAGTGGTTTFLLPRLPADRTEYVFTDVSQLFLARAKDKFRDYPFVEYRLFDAEKDPASQGFADGQFDMVMGANVFHATGDLRLSLRNVRRLLAPAGLLVMLEGTGRRRLLDMIFGLTDGWWKFQDADLRQGCPLLSPASWTRLLSQEKFPEVAIVPVPDEAMPDPDQAVVLARCAAVAMQRSEPLHNGVATMPETGVAETTSGPTWIAVSNRSELAERVTEKLAKHGANVVHVHSGEMYAWEGKNRCWIRPGEQADMEALLSEVQGRPFEVIDFTESGSAYAWPGAVRHWVVTHGAAPLGGEAPTSPAWQSWLDGRQDAALRLVDVDPEATADSQAEAVSGMLLHHDDESALAYRGDQRYVPRRARPAEASERTGAIAKVDRQALLAASPFDRRAMVEGYLRREFANVLGLELAAEDLDKPLQAFGLDSLMGIQFRNRVEAGLGVSLSIVDFLKGLSLGQIVENSLKELAASAEAQAARPRKDTAMPGNLTADKVSNLSEGELDNLLQSLMDS